ncbi:hypothetical protein DXV76_00045 [Rhodobacteraceae bacterium CCMM004]|nr:hypothetical protein DXV76_00045 [Rhodobacteraceae bacterium CCMM004]
MKTIAGFITACSIACSALAPQASHADTLTIALDYDPADLYGTLSTNNPMFAMLESLYLDDPRTGQVEPYLALSHEMASPTEVMVTLREGVTFSNGEPMDAEAVVHSVTVFSNPEIVPAYGIYAPMIDSAEVIDDTTVKIVLSEPNPIVDLLLAQIIVVPPDYWEEVGGTEGFGQAPVGTGPFVLTDWVKDDRIVMDTNPDYWGDLPENIDEVVWRTVPEASSRAAGLRTGEYDLAMNLPAIDVDAINAEDGLTVYEGDVARIFSLVLSSLDIHETPVQDRLVRQAINYAIDKQTIIDALYFGKARLLNGQVVLPGQPGYDPEMTDYPFDPEKARELLAEAGYPDGIDVEFKCASNRYAQGLETCEAIAAMLGDVGINASLTLLESGEFIGQYVRRELAPIGLIGLGVPNDPSFGIGVYRSDWRYSYYQNPEMDALIDASRSETDPEARAEIIRQASQLLFDDAVIAYLFGAQSFFGHSDDLEGFATNVAQRFFVHTLSLAE